MKSVKVLLKNELFLEIVQNKESIKKGTHDRIPILIMIILINQMDYQNQLKTQYP